MAIKSSESIYCGVPSFERCFRIVREYTLFFYIPFRRFSLFIIGVNCTKKKMLERFIEFNLPDCSSLKIKVFREIEHRLLDHLLNITENLETIKLAIEERISKG